MRPLWYEFPDKEELFDVDDEFMLGPGMLIKPVTHVRPSVCRRYRDRDNMLIGSEPAYASAHMHVAYW